MHGSWDRTAPVGYKVSTIDFADGSPVAPSDSMTALTDIFYNADNTKCPNTCFRPVGLALDSHGRMFVSSDKSGEIFVLAKTGAATTTSSGTQPSATKNSSAMKWGADWFVAVVSVGAVGFAIMLL
jgi:hypothetical protein